MKSIILMRGLPSECSVPSFGVQYFFLQGAVIFPSGCSVPSFGVQPISLEVQPANTGVCGDFPRSAAFEAREDSRYCVHAAAGIVGLTESKIGPNVTGVRHKPFN
jgi:hypothetical protein